MTVTEKIEIIRGKLARAGGGRKIILVGVAKTKPAELIREAVAAGIDAVGENYVQEFRQKSAQGAYGNCPVHIIGHLQQNKVKAVAGRVSLIQSVDSPGLLASVAKKAASLDTVQDVLIEVNIGEEASKTGLDPARLDEVLAAAGGLAGVRIRGLMTIPPTENTRAYFEKMYNIYIDINSKKYDNVTMDFLSMGMSDDYEDAIRAGANMVRVGSAVFGPRNQVASIT